MCVKFCSKLNNVYQASVVLITRSSVLVLYIVDFPAYRSFCSTEFSLLSGFFGMVVLSVLLVPMYFIRVPAMFAPTPPHRLEDALFAFRQIAGNPLIAVALTGTIARFCLESDCLCRLLRFRSFERPREMYCFSSFTG